MLALGNTDTRTARWILGTLRASVRHADTVLMLFKYFQTLNHFGNRLRVSWYDSLIFDPGFRILENLQFGLLIGYGRGFGVTSSIGYRSRRAVVSIGHARNFLRR